MKRCLVTGAGGFLGTNLVRELVKNNYKVRVLKRPSSNFKYIEDLDVEYAEGDITNLDSLLEATRGVDYVFNVAGDTAFWKRRNRRQRQTNVDGAVNVAEACLRNKVKRLVHTGTMDAIGYNPDGVADESWESYNIAGTGNHYVDTKREGEQRVLEYVDKGLDVVVVLPGSLVGPYDFTLQFGRVFFDLRDGKIPFFPTGGVSFGHVGECARGHVAAAEKGKKGERYILGGVNATYRELFTLMGGKIGAKVPKMDAPEWVFVLYGWLMENLSYITNQPPDMNPGMARFMSIKAYYDSGKAIKELGYKVPTLQAMVDDAYDWYQKEGFFEKY